LVYPILQPSDSAHPSWGLLAQCQSPLETP
jgi:hypothetical protein